MRTVAENPSAIDRSSLRIVNPLEISDWDERIGVHEGFSFFHTRAWAAVLHGTYGHKPTYVVAESGGDRWAVLPLMEVASVVTGRRGVSLPFTDRCDTLAESSGEAIRLQEAAFKLGQERGWRFLELRGGRENRGEARPSVEFLEHTVRLDGGPEAAFGRCQSSVRRAIRKAESEGLAVEIGTGLAEVSEYYSLHVRTRRRHGVPPQPFRFFRSLWEHAISCGKGFVVIARLGRKAIASAVFLQVKQRGIYKFGASDLRYQSLRPNNLVMWKAIEFLAGKGFSELYLGRTSMGQEGLRRFKIGFGAVENLLQYAKFDFRQGSYVVESDRALGWHNYLFRVMPSPLLRWAGALLYPHLS